MVDRADVLIACINKLMLSPGERKSTPLPVNADEEIEKSNAWQRPPDDPSDSNRIHVLFKKLTQAVMQTIAAKMEGQDEEIVLIQTFSFMSSLPGVHRNAFDLQIVSDPVSALTPMSGPSESPAWCLSRVRDRILSLPSLLTASANVCLFIESIYNPFFISLFES